MIERYRGIWARRAVLDTLVRRDLRVRYARSWLGYLWTIIDPLAMALIYFVVFAVIFKRPDAGHKPYFLFLLIGLLPWQWFNASINESARALVPEAQAGAVDEPATRAVGDSGRHRQGRRVPAVASRAVRLRRRLRRARGHDAQLAADPLPGRLSSCSSCS